MALAAPQADTWASDVARAVAVVRSAFATHISIVEGQDGLFAEMLREAPRLAGTLGLLHREHDDITAQLALAKEELDEGALERARERLPATLAKVARHRKREVDLLYEAYETDIGGE